MAIDDLLAKAAGSDAGGILGWLAAGAASITLGYQKIRRMANADREAADSTDAKIDILSQLRSEIDRLSEQNIKLIGIVHSLQLEVIDLRNENAALKRHVGLQDGQSPSKTADQRS